MTDEKCKYVIIKDGLTALVDEDDFEKVNLIKWHIHDKGYARGYDKKNKKMVYMHNLILPKLKGFVTDHKNNNKLDNRKSNLCILTNLQNITRSGPRKNHPKGVYFNKRGKWEVRIGGVLFWHFFREKRSDKTLQ